MTYRDQAADSYWTELGGQAAPAGESLPSIDTCFVCGKPGHFAVACRLHPARLRKIKGDACGPGACTGTQPDDGGAVLIHLREDRMAPLHLPVFVLGQRRAHG